MNEPRSSTPTSQRLRVAVAGVAIGSAVLYFSDLSLAAAFNADGRMSRFATVQSAASAFVKKFGGANATAESGAITTRSALATSSTVAAPASASRPQQESASAPITNVARTAAVSSAAQPGTVEVQQALAMPPSDSAESLMPSGMFVGPVLDVAEDRRWTGGSPDFANWSDTRNWENGDNPDSDSGSRAFFGNNGAARPTSNDDYGGFHDFGQIIFDATTVSYTLTGTSIKLFSKVEVTGTSSQTFAIASVALGGGNAGGTTEFNPVGGDLNVTSSNIFGDGKTLAIFGAKTVTFTGNYQNGSGTSNLTLNMGSTGVANFNGASSFSGTTTLNGGTLGLGNDSAIGTSLLRFSGTSNVSAVGGARTIANNVTLSGASMIFSGANSLQINGSLTGGDGTDRRVDNRVTAGTLTLAGPVYISANAANARTLTFGASSGATTNAFTTTVVSGVIANNAGSNTTASNIAAQGGGLVVLSGNNTYTGTTTINNGDTELRIGSGGATGNLGSGAVTVNSGLLSFNRNNAMAVANAISGSGRVSQIGTGTTTLAAANTYTGATTISAGTLDAAATNALGNNTTGTSGITVNSGGTLRFSNNATTDRVRDTAGLTLAGGTLSMNGVSEGAAGTTGIGALTLSANSTIDFAVGATNSIIQFAGLGAHTPGNTGADLAITNWDGVRNVGGGTERLLFSGTASDFTTKFDQTDVSFNGLSGYRTSQFTGFYEVTAVPEPSTWITAGLCLVAVGWTQRRRVLSLASRRSA